MTIAAFLASTTVGCLETDDPLPDRLRTPPATESRESDDPGSARATRENHPDPTAHEIPTEPAEQEATSEPLEPGAITGLWKLVRVEIGDQIGHFSFAHAKGDPILDGSYAMRYGLNRYFDGISGELVSGEARDGRAELGFNPTPNAEQRFQVELERDGEVWTGQLRAELDPAGERMDVRLVPLNESLVVGVDPWRSRLLAAPPGGGGDVIAGGPRLFWNE